MRVDATKRGRTPVRTTRARFVTEIECPPPLDNPQIRMIRLPGIRDGRGRGRSRVRLVDDLLVTEGRALKHVQVREYVRALVVRGGPGLDRAVRARARAPLRRRPHDGAPGDGRARRRGTARADPRPRDVRGPAAARGQPGDVVQRGDGAPRPARRVADPAGPPRAGRPGGGPRAEPQRGRRGDPLAPAAPRRRRPDVHRGRLPQRGPDPRLPAERHADQPVRRARARAGCARPGPRTRSTPTPPRDEEAGCSRSRPARRCCGTRVGRWPATRSSRCRARSTAPTGSRCGCSWARRAERLRAPSAATAPAGLLAHPDRVRPAEVGLDVERVHRRVPQVRQTGQRPTDSNSASCTSWATSPATYTSPSGHCSAHHLRWETASSRAETAAGGRVVAGLEVGEHPGAGVEQQGVVHDPHHARGPTAGGDRPRAARAITAGCRPRVGAWARRCSR